MVRSSRSIEARRRLGRIDFAPYQAVPWVRRAALPDLRCLGKYHYLSFIFAADHVQELGLEADLPVQALHERSSSTRSPVTSSGSCYP